MAPFHSIALCRRTPATARRAGTSLMSPLDGRRFFFLGELQVMPRNLSVMIANLLDQCAVGKSPILHRAGAIFLGLDVGPPCVLAFPAVGGGEPINAPLPRHALVKLSGLSPLHETTGLITKGSVF